MNHPGAGHQRVDTSEHGAEVKAPALVAFQRRHAILMKALICVISSIVLSVYLCVKVAGTPDIPKPQQLREEYESTKATIAKQRDELSRRYLQSQTAQERERILHDSQSLLIQTLTERIFPAWYGTQWGFNGMSRIPGEGEIACGTFVVFTLQDAGFDIPTRMAQQPSENILKNFIGNKGMQRFSNHVPMEKIIAWIKTQGEGVYLVGLDIHVGFVLYQNDVITFCHSNYYTPPRMVENQPILDPSPLTDSKYRVIGKLLTEDMVKKWLLEQNFPVTYDYFKR